MMPPKSIARLSFSWLIALFVCTALGLRAEDEPPFLSIRFEHPTSLKDAANAVHERFKSDFDASGQPALTKDEILNALAIGNGSLFRPQKNELADLCVDCFKSQTVPAGAGFNIQRGEHIGAPGSDQLRRFFFIYLYLSLDPPPAEKDRGNVPSPEMLARTVFVPVRLTPAMK